MDVERASERVSGPGLLDASNNRAEGRTLLQISMDINGLLTMMTASIIVDMSKWAGLQVMVMCTPRAMVSHV
jgi:hypothetical protein